MQVKKKFSKFKTRLLFSPFYYICARSEGVARRKKKNNMNQNNYGFVRVAAAMPRVYVADCRRNSQQIIALAKELDSKGVWVAAFPELSVTGYTCADLFSSHPLLEQAEKACGQIVLSSRELNAALVFGAPVAFRGRLFNCAVVCRRGKILGIVPKTYLAGNAEFYEPRWFESARVLEGRIERISYAGQECDFGTGLLFSMGELKFGV